LVKNAEGIVLNQHKYGNSSLICNLFTAEYGKINIIAKGARTIKNPHSAILQTGHHIDLIYYHKSTRNIQTLKEASIVNAFQNINKDYKKTICSLTIIDIINKISFQDNPCDIIFRLIQRTLGKINKTKTDHIDLYYIFFQIQLLIYLGYHPSFFQCYKCSQKLINASFDLNIGQVLCLKCNSQNKAIINTETINNLKIFMNTHINDIEKKINFNNLIEINNLLYKFISYHVPEIRKSKLFTSEK